jgi:hypothetical protein
VTSPRLERFLVTATIIYGVSIVLMVPGLFGFFCVVLIVYVLGGLSLLVDAMDRPFDSRQHLIRADNKVLVEYLQSSGPATPAMRRHAGET